VVALRLPPQGGSTTVAYASNTGGMAAVMVRPMFLALLVAIHATSASVPMRHVLPSLSRVSTPPA
jgi:hypothetical protein